MATNMIYKNADNLRVPVGAGIESGDPVVVGGITGVALVDRDSDGYAVIRRKGVFSLEVSAVSTDIDVGTPVYITSSNTLTNTVGSNTLFGYALEAVASGTSATIKVLLK